MILKFIEGILFGKIKKETIKLMDARAIITTDEEGVHEITRRGDWFMDGFGNIYLVDGGESLRRYLQDSGRQIIELDGGHMMPINHIKRILINETARFENIEYRTGGLLCD